MPKFEHLKNGEGIVRLTASHSLFVGHRPPSVKCEEGLCENILSEATEESVAQFGLFGGSNDLNKFYPELTADDWTPKDADFIQPVYRALSETVVYQFGYIPIDFSKEGILKASMAKLKGQTVNTNHDTEVENAVGAVSSVKWQEATKVGGVKVPAGINATFKIDAKSNPRLARGILMDPPAIHSDSVTVRFKHEPSHTFEDKDEFWRKLGTFDEDGKLIRLIVTDLISYKEVSLVSHGADPYAQVVNEDNEINDPKYAAAVYNFKDNNSINNKPRKSENMEFTELLAKLGLQDSGIKDWQELVAHFNKEPEAAPEVALYNALVEVDADLTPASLTALRENQVADGQVILQEGQEIVTEAQTATLNKVEELGGLEKVEAGISLGDQMLTQIRSNAVRDYKLIAKDGASDAIIGQIEAADLDAAKAFESHYHQEVEKAVPLKCGECGSDNVSRASHTKDPEDKGDEGETKNTHKDRVKRFSQQNRRKASDIHKEDKS